MESTVYRQAGGRPFEGEDLPRRTVPLRDFALKEGSFSSNDWTEEIRNVRVTDEFCQLIAVPRGLGLLS